MCMFSTYFLLDFGELPPEELPWGETLVSAGNFSMPELYCVGLRFDRVPEKLTWPLEMCAVRLV